MRGKHFFRSFVSPRKFGISRKYIGFPTKLCICKCILFPPVLFSFHHQTLHWLTKYLRSLAMILHSPQETRNSLVNAQFLLTKSLNFSIPPRNLGEYEIRFFFYSVCGHLLKLCNFPKSHCVHSQNLCFFSRKNIMFPHKICRSLTNAYFFLPCHIISISILCLLTELSEGAQRFLGECKMYKHRNIMFPPMSYFCPLRGSFSTSLGGAFYFYDLINFTCPVCHYYHLSHIFVFQQVKKSFPWRDSLSYFYGAERLLQAVK